MSNNILQAARPFPFTLLAFRSALLDGWPAPFQAEHGHGHRSPRRGGGVEKHGALLAFFVLACVVRAVRLGFWRPLADRHKTGVDCGDHLRAPSWRTNFGGV